MFGYEPKGRGFESLLARQNRSFGCLNRSFYFFVHFNILHARGTRTRREEQSDGRKQSGGLFLPTGQRAEGEAIGAGSTGTKSLLARQNKSVGCLNRSFYFFAHFNILHARGTRTRREEQSDGRKQSGGLFLPTGQRAEGEAIGAGSTGTKSLLARQNKSVGCLNRSFYFFAHFNILHARGTRTRREEQSEGRKQSGGLFSPTGQRAEGEAIGAGKAVAFGNDFQI